MKEKTKVYTSNPKFYAWKYLHKLTHFPCIRLYKCSCRNRRCWCSWNSHRKEGDQESTHQHLIWTNYGKFINSSNKPSFFRLCRLAKMNHFRATLFFHQSYYLGGDCEHLTFLPLHIVPFPEYPCLQVQLKEPSELMHRAFLSHALESP